MKKTVVLISLITAIIVFITSCEKEGGNSTKISRYNETESHNIGQNCMNCHKSGGDGEGWFNVAGTVYDDTQTNTVKNATINLYTGMDGTGTLKYTIQVDGLGNFYTTEPIDLTTPLYPSVTGSTSTNYMSTSITTGACNSCHNVSTGKIWAQ